MTTQKIRWKGRNSDPTSPYANSFPESTCPRRLLLPMLVTLLVAFCGSALAQSANSMRSIEEAMKTAPKSMFIPPPDLLGADVPGSIPLTLAEAMDKYGDRVRKQQASEHPLPQVMVFLSFSVPQARLASYSSQVKEVGGVILLRGMHEGSIKKTLAKTLESTPKGDVPWLIHPDLFRQFKIDKVPAIVIADREGLQPEGVTAVQTNYAKVEGDVSVELALKMIKERGNSVMAAMATERLERLQKTRQ